jgi:hypothetical protein
MSRARNLADLLDANGDVASGALDNVPPSNDASALTTGTLPVDRVPYVGRRNLVINGAMQVWQRGTDTGSRQNNTYYGAADRWLTHGSGGWYQATKQDISIGSENDIGGCQSFLRFDVTSSSDFLHLENRVEDVRSLRSGESYTLSFYAKGTNPNQGYMNVRFSQNYGSGGSAETQNDHTVTLTSNWQRFIITGTYPDLSGKTIGDGNFIRVLFGQEADTSAAAWQLNITGVQLEVGSVATPFEHRSYGEELALCQRYYYRPGYEASSLLTYNIVYKDTGGGSSGWTSFQVPFPVTMRTIPTFSHNLSDSNQSGGSPGTTYWRFYEQNIGYPSKHGASNMSVLSASATTTHSSIGAYYVSPNGTASGIRIGSDLTFEFSAEI